MNCFISHFGRQVEGKSYKWWVCSFVDFGFSPILPPLLFYFFLSLVSRNFLLSRDGTKSVFPYCVCGFTVATLPLYLPSPRAW
ncbi:hypothetical protein QBC43DRAFT_314715 [Cladorrhinum sp. PSN259]|nr:hypothetical protein QBC43DRAFT_314715 [Cladorrhinum sp. PSN259]